MNVRFAPRALAEAGRIMAWWRGNRPKAPDLFEEELQSAIDRLAETPTLGAPYNPGMLEAATRRVLLPKTGFHVYYAIDHEHLVILSIWGARRGRAPSL